MSEFFAMSSGSTKRACLIRQMIVGWIGLAGLAGLAWAEPQTCDARSQHLAYVREDLRRAGMEADFPTALDFADRGRRELDQLAVTAGRCGCAPAQAGFETLAVRLKRAGLVETRQDLRDAVKQLPPLLDEAISHLKDCARR